MRLFGKSPAKRLRTGPALLLSDTSEDELLDTVRRFDPSAEPGEGTIKLRGMALEGPIDITPELAGKATLPAGWSTAYLAEALIRHRPHAVALVRGLAHALNGKSHQAGGDMTDDMWLDPVVSVFIEDPVPVEEIREAVATYMDGLDRAPDQRCVLRGDGPIYIEYGGLMSHDPERLPPMLDQRRPSVECAVLIEHESLPITSEVLHRAGRIALALVGTFGGAALDIHHFKVQRPEHVHLDP